MELVLLGKENKDADFVVVDELLPEFINRNEPDRIKQEMIVLKGAYQDALGKNWNLKWANIPS
jgi:hypothetical protein